MVMWRRFPTKWSASSGYNNKRRNLWWNSLCLPRKQIRCECSSWGRKTATLLPRTEADVHPRKLDRCVWGHQTPHTQRVHDGRSRHLQCPKKTPCFRKLWVSHDFGRSWVNVVDRVQQFEWTEEVPKAIRPKNWQPGPHSIIATVFRKGTTGNQNLDHWDTHIDFVITEDEFKTRKVVVPHGNRFLIMANKFFVRDRPKKEPTPPLTSWSANMLSMFIPIEMPAMSEILAPRFHCCRHFEGQVFAN